MAWRVIVISMASLLMAVNIKTFVHTGALIPGGATGLTLLIQEVALSFFKVRLPFTVINLLINAVPVYIGFRYIGKKFTILSCWVIFLTSILTDIIPYYMITQDILLISIFGGLINGACISVCLLMDATSGGIDFITIYLSERRGIDSFNIALMINGVILIVAGLLFNWNKALYSIIFQMASTMMIRTLYHKYQQATLFIVTNKPREVCEVISRISNHGSTVLEGEGSYEHCERNVVYSVVSGGEAGRVIAAVKKEDPEAFANVLKTERVIGRFYQRPAE
ncbi:MAG: YitT family protein [Lachnospiraceae bacterium]|nr:YitT family protein [Lachnospiraceae bacterium]MBQ9607762.1 YitT family protein [Lachnospiraceae bacterium]